MGMFVLIIPSLISIFALISLIRLYLWRTGAKVVNPFEVDTSVPRRPYIHDQKKRDNVIKQGFSRDKVPAQLDAILIGSGIGSLTAAAVLARAGKKVLVLEQHDQAGGCCHTFVDKNYEFDVGIHYIGEMGRQTLNKTLLDQISEGQIEWAPLEEDYDVVKIGYGEDGRSYPVRAGNEAWKEQLKKQFPDEIEAIDKYVQMMKTTKASVIIHFALKLAPLWVVRLALITGVLRLLTNLFKPEYTKRSLDLIEGLTSNKDLQTVFMYSWGDYGTQPSKSPFMMQALLNRHFTKFGSHYPVGGASEIAFNIIPIIEKVGGKVLVRANVSEIIVERGKACGVKVGKAGKECIEIRAPVVISSAGLYNTFQKLLPRPIASRSYFYEICNNLKPGNAGLNVFLGLNKNAEELGLPRQSFWAFTNNDINREVDKYFAMSAEDVMDSEIPLLFISFPSSKDPEWKNHPGRENKATCAIVTLGNWNWFKEWVDKPVKKRGDGYEEVKQSIGHQMIEQTCKLFPQLRDCIDFTDIGSPVTNTHYIAQPYGEIYGLDHSLERFEPLMVSKLRPKTDIPGLFLTGQDIMTCGFTGALYGGLLSAQMVLGRNVMSDLIKLNKKLRAKEKKL